MAKSTLRTRLLGGAVLGAGIAMLVPTQASAQCTLAAPNLTCLDTTTVDTTYPVNSGTGTDRVYFDDNAQNTTVGAGVTVDGFGLFISNPSGPFVVTNDGSVQVDAGNTPAPIFGQSGALQIATNSSPMVYSGLGSIVNFGTGEGFSASIFTDGSLDANFGGTVRADNGDGIQVRAGLSTPTSGPITIVTNVVNASGGDGIDVTTAGPGDVTITSNNGIQDSVGLGDLQNGIIVNSTGTGNITIDHNAGAIGNTVDRAQLVGISATINNAASIGTIDIGTLAGTGINTVGDGINATTNGTGNIVIANGAAITSTSGDGIEATSTGTGNVTIANTGAIGSSATPVGGSGILGTITDAASAGNVLITNGALAVWSTNVGIEAVTIGTGNATIITGWELSAVPGFEGSAFKPPLEARR